jgi:hypothetical protein
MSIAFKEWTLICDALGRGEQSVILRKGGIAEGRDGFRFKHDEFLLFPTLFHEQLTKLKLPASTALPTRAEGEPIVVQVSVRVEWTRDVTDWETVRRLARFHLWQEAEIEKRFRQDDQPGVSLAFVRASRLSRPFTFPDATAYGGCRSWVNVPDLPAEITATAALDDAVHREQERQIRAVLGD